MVRIIRLILIVAVVVVSAVFTVLNPDPVAIDYVFNQKEFPLALIVVIAIVIGAALGFLVMTGRVMQLRYNNAVLNRKNQGLIKQLHNKQAAK